MPIASLSRHAPGLFTPALELYHLLPLHMPLTLFLLDAPFGRFAPKGKKWVVNGNISWFCMEIVAPSVLLWTLGSIPVQLSTNSAVLAGVYITHYFHRAIMSPLVLSPKRSDVHIIVPIVAAVYNVLNAYCLAVGLAFYPAPQSSRTLWCLAGWAVGFLGNVYHDEILNDLRRPDAQKLVTSPSKEHEKDKKAGNGRYAIPRGGLFDVVSFPNYLCE
ncbi:hypothetical protein DB88DRAFT_278549 [Papiliotrema laurentii]|uniref:3-oxo-5-alpha-steroid 4-dehydrogenase C-terminal domain-containing protein n=1 Tax=Papiliotrema laurentii TaxID=5418 RepID=A0AAD9CYG7_PAPLA|nr:hypothetical protein DB88DRAFT_278549 [Papiliotrema laurentii]